MRRVFYLVAIIASVIVVGGCPNPSAGSTPPRGGGSSSNGSTEYAFTPDTTLIYQELGYTPYFFGVAYGNGAYVAVGSGGTVITSTDGTNWYLTESEYTQAQSIVKAQNGGRKLPGGARTLAVKTPASQKGHLGGPAVGGRTLIQWDSYNSDISDDLIGVAYGNGVFVAQAYDGGVYVSSDNGSSWTFVQSLSQAYFSCITYLNSVFVGIAVDGSDSQTNGVSFLLTSTDGVNWTTPVEIPLGGEGTWEYYSGIAYGNNTYVAVNWNWSYNDAQIAYSTEINGAWQVGTASIALPPQYSLSSLSLESVAFGNGKFVAVGTAYNSNTSYNSPIVLVSTDGINWSSQDLPIAGTPETPLSFDLSGVAEQDGNFVVVGDYWNNGLGGIVLTSTTGTSWSYQYYSTGAGGVAFGDGMFAVSLGESAWYHYYSD